MNRNHFCISVLLGPRGCKIPRCLGWVPAVAVLLLFLQVQAEETIGGAPEPESTLAQELPGEVAGLTAKYHEAISEAKSPLQQLKQSYSSRLESLKKSAMAGGDLETVVSIQNEMGQVKNGEPGKDNKNPAIAKLQSTYHQHFPSIAGEAYAKCVRVEETYVRALKGLVAAFTRENRIDEAVVTRHVLQTANARLADWNRLSRQNNPEDAEAEPLDWARLEKAIQEKKFATTSAVGGNTAVRPRDADTADEPALLVGFKVFFKGFGGSKNTVRGVIPIFKTKAGRRIEGLHRGGSKNGDWRRFVAKEGYVVGALDAISTNAVRKLKITFHRISGNRANPGDSYDTGWLGDWEGGTPASLKTDGRLAVGVDGFYGLGLDQLALIVIDD